MAPSSITPPHYSPTSSSSSSKPYSQNRNHYQTHRLTHHQNYLQNQHPGNLSLFTPSRPPPTPLLNAAKPQSPIPNPISFTSPNSLSYHHHHPLPSQSELSPDFSARRSTRFVSKFNHSRHKASVASRHSSAAEEALQQLLIGVPSGGGDIDRVLVDFEPKLRGNTDDYTFLLRELGNRGQYSTATRCFEFAIHRETRRNELGKLATAMISVLGRLGRVDLARSVFDTAVKDGYGNTVYAYSALISAYAKSGRCDEAIKVFDTMKASRLNPNLVTYNALIDACRKGGAADCNLASKFFNEIKDKGLQPDRITYNSLLAVFGGAGLWNNALTLFYEMDDRGIDQDVYSYNTLLDAACNCGHLDVAFEIMKDMPSKNLLPNEVTYSTLIRACAKAGRLDHALGLFDQMKFAGVKLDRVSYNTLLSIYASLGMFEEALSVVHEMESMGIKKDVVTYNALLDGYGKQGEYEKMKELFQEMKAESFQPNLLTYSTLISVYLKGGLYGEATEVYKEFKRGGWKADVVFYSKLIDAQCKNGQVESAALLLEEMTANGIQPNVVTYNSIINAFGATREYPIDGAGGSGTSGSLVESSQVVLRDAIHSRVEHTDGDRIIQIFVELAAGTSCHSNKDKRGRQEILCILGVFQKMHKLKIKPNVVTFSAILTACSRCSSLEEASLLLKQLGVFDNQVYVVAHGLLMGHRENMWLQAVSLFDEVRRMGSSTASAFFNALTDVLWHFGQRCGAQKVVLEGERLRVWENTRSDFCLDLHLMSSGAACAMVHDWLLNISSIMCNGKKLPEQLCILTGWGNHSKVKGDGTLKRVIKTLLDGLGAPFGVTESNIGRFISTRAQVASWLRKSGTLNVLILHDDRASPQTARLPRLHTIPL